MVVDFCDYFWGEKNGGFDVLYHNMKYGLVASKELSEFLRERASLEETYSKQLGKLAKQCGSSTSIAAANSANANPNGTPNIGPLCSFTPLWQLLKTSCDKIAQLQLQMAQKLNDMVKDVGKYSEELARKQKVVKESESSTVEAIQILNQTNVALNRSKEAYFQRGGELTKLRRDNSTSSKDLERADTKFRKAAEEYRNLVDKYAQLREDFERKMTVSCRHFQEVEEGHLNQMRNFLSGYINVLCSNYEAVAHVHVDLQQQWDDLAVDRLLEMFVVSKMTGLEKPLAVEFEEYPLDSELTSSNSVSQQLPECLEEWPSAPSASTGNSKDEPRRMFKKANNKEEKKEKRGKRDSEESRVASSKQGSRRATSLLNLFTSSSSSSPNAQGKGKVRAGKSRARKTADGGGGGGGDDDPDAEPASREDVGVTSGRGMGGSAPATPTEAETAVNQSVIGSWSRNSLRGSKYDSPPRSSTSSSAQPSISGLGIASLTGFLKSRRKKEKEKDKEREKDKKGALKKKRDSDASSVKSDGEPSLNASGGIIAGSGGSIGSGAGVGVAAAVGSAIPDIGSTSGSGAIEKERLDREDNLLSTISDPASDSGVRVDDEGYTIRPRDDNWNAEKTSGFYSSSEADSDDEPERKLHVEIKPITNGANPPSASVDELKATIESLNIGSSMFNNVGRKNISLDSYSAPQLGKSSSDLVGLNLFQSPTNSNTSTPTGLIGAGQSGSFGSVVSPSGIGSPANRQNTATPAGEDLFDELGEIVPALPPKQGRVPAPGSRGSTPTLGSIAVPRPPSRRGLEGTNRPTAASPLTLQSTPQSSTATVGNPSLVPRTDSIGSLELRPASSPTSISRPPSRSAGPSPLTISMPASGSTAAVDSIPLAVAFQEVVHALFRGPDESRCQVRINGDMMLSFPAGLIQLINSQPSSIPPISFRIRNIQNLDNIVPNKQVLTIEHDLMSVEPLFHFNMPQLTALLKRQSEQNPSASYFNVDILKYQVKSQPGAATAPLHLVAYWKCESSLTDVRLDYKFNAHAQATPAALRNLMISIPIEGAVTSMQAKPQGEWMSNSNRALWKLPEMSTEADGANVGSIRARFQLTGGSGSPTTVTAHFGCDGSTMSGAEMELVSSGYRTSLVKRRFVAGKYLCEADADARTRYAAPPGPTSTEC